MLPNAWSFGKIKNMGKGKVEKEKNDLLMSRMEKPDNPPTSKNLIDNRKH